MLCQAGPSKLMKSIVQIMLKEMNAKVPSNMDLVTSEVEQPPVKEEEPAMEEGEIQEPCKEEEEVKEEEWVHEWSGEEAERTEDVAGTSEGTPEEEEQGDVGSASFDSNSSEQ